MKKLLGPLVVLGAIPLGIVAYDLQMRNAFASPDHAAAIVAVGLAFVIAGAFAWWRAPGDLFGVVLMAAGIALLARQLRHSPNDLIFTVFFMLGEVGYLLVGYCALAYPSGRLKGRLERALPLGFAIAVGFPLAMLLFAGPDNPPPGYLGDPASHTSLIAIDSDPLVVERLQKAFVITFYIGVSAGFIALIVRRFALATPRMRRLLVPLFVAAAVFAARGISEGILNFASWPYDRDYLFWWQVGSAIALPLALLAGFLRARLARASVGDLVLELERTPPSGMRAALARTLGDPTLELGFWLPASRSYVDTEGKPVELPAADSNREITTIEHDGQPLAAIVHDASLRDEPKLVQAAGAATHLALENARLQAETRAQLLQVQQSRARIVTAGDEARRRIERDLHDGAQQRLVALALQLRTAQRRLGSQGDHEVDLLLETAASELQAAVTELRELARGVHPAILTEEGLAAALESLTSKSSLAVSLDVCEDRLPAQVEATAYFVACEALTNVAKHSHAERAAVVGRRRNGTFVLEVEDDGIGGAAIGGNSGLRGLVDRVEALGGRLTIDSPAGAGTRIAVEIPCAS